MGHSKSSSERKVYSNTTLSQERRKSSNKQPNPTCKTAREGRTKPKISRRKEIIMMRKEINEIKTKETIEKNQLKVDSLIKKIDKPLDRLSRKKREVLKSVN